MDNHISIQRVIVARYRRIIKPPNRGTTMDLSKLPHRSSTTSPPPPAAQPTAPPVTTGVGAEIWISAIVGIVLMLLGRSFAIWAFTTLTGGTYATGFHWQTGPQAGQPVGYWELLSGVAWTDSGIFLLGLALVLEAITLLVAVSGTRRTIGLIGFSLALTVAATVYNAIVAGILFSKDILPLLSILALGFGGYIAAYQYRLLKLTQRSAPIQDGGVTR